MFFRILTGKCNNCKSSLTKLLIHCSAKDTSSVLSVALLESMQPQTEPALGLALLGFPLSLGKCIFINS